MEWADEIAGALTLLGANVGRIIGAMLKGVDLQASNLAGPPTPISIAGVRLERLVGFGPRAGSPLNLTLISYDGVARIGAHTDPAAIPDPERAVQLARRLRRSAERRGRAQAGAEASAARRADAARRGVATRGIAASSGVVRRRPRRRSAL